MRRDDERAGALRALGAEVARVVATVLRDPIVLCGRPGGGVAERVTGESAQGIECFVAGRRDLFA